MRVISNFSAGVTSTIATKLAIDEYGVENVRIVFFETGAHHPDNERFIKECEDKLFGKQIEVFRNRKYDSPLDVARKTKYVNGPSGARCTMELKKKIRQNLEKFMDYDLQIFGFEYQKKEMNRAFRFAQQYPDAKPVFPLIEHKYTKEMCLKMLSDYDIEIPTMYKLKYHNNNCLGCFKGGMGYWNKIRKDFPDVFDDTAKMEREVGNSCIKGVFLDELDPSAGRHTDLSFECGAFCQVEMFGLSEFDNLQELANKIRGEQEWLE